MAHGAGYREDDAMTELVVMRLCDMHRLHPSQDNSRVCARCGEPVGIYPSGQAALRRDSSLKIVCNACVGKEGRDVVGVPAAPWQEIAQEARDSRELKKQ
jgi:hypothetical protein